MRVGVDCLKLFGRDRRILRSDRKRARGTTCRHGGPSVLTMTLGGMPGSLGPLGSFTASWWSLFKRFERALALAISVALVLTILFQVMDRFLFGGALQLGWTEEIARILLLWLTFWGAILVQEEDSQIRLEFVLHALPPRARAYAYILIDLAILAFLVVIIINAVPYALHEIDLTLPATRLPRSVLVLAVIVGSCFMAGHVVRHMLTRVQRLRSANPRRE